MTLQNKSQPQNKNNNKKTPCISARGFKLFVYSTGKILVTAKETLPKDKV